MYRCKEFENRLYFTEAQLCLSLLSNKQDVCRSRTCGDEAESAFRRQLLQKKLGYTAATDVSPAINMMVFKVLCCGVPAGAKQRNAEAGDVEEGK